MSEAERAHGFPRCFGIAEEKQKRRKWRGGRGTLYILAAQVMWSERIGSRVDYV